MEFLQIWQILLRRKWIFLSVFFGFFFLVVILLLLIPKTYEANAKILVDKSLPVANLSQILGLKIPSDRSEDYEYQTEIALALNKVILKELITALNLKDKNGDTLETDDFVKSNLLNKFMPQPYINVEQYEDSEILEISATADNPEQAAAIANKLAELYIQSEIKITNTEYGKMRIFVEQKIRDTKISYYLLFEELKEYMNKEGIVSISLQTEQLIAKVSSLKDSYESNEKEILEREKNIQNLKKQADAREVFRKDSKDFSYNDQIKTFKSKIGELLITLAGKSVDVRKEHPDFIQIERQIEKARDLLQKEANFILSSESYSIDPIYDSLSKQLIEAYINQEIALVRRTILKKYLDAYYQEMMGMTVKKIENTKIEDKLSVNKEIYQSLEKYLVQIGIAESLTLSNIRVVEPAKVPEEPDFPKPPIILALALFFGTVWSLFAGFFIDYIDVNIKDFYELKRIDSVELLGNIPFHNDLKNKKTVAGLNHPHPVLDSYRAIRNNMRIVEQQQFCPKILMITSSCDGEGKTSFASNIAATLSNEGINTILVDMHINAPSIHHYFGMENNRGLADLVTSDAQVDDRIGKAAADHLSVIPAGVFGRAWFNKDELEKVHDLLKDLKKQYDMVILDMPSIYPSKDTYSLAKFVDGAIYTIAPGSVTAEVLQETVDLLRKFDIGWIGLVANRFNDKTTYQFISPLKWFKK